eukprot:3290563-Amphidinium_carterae.2
MHGDVLEIHKPECSHSESLTTNGPWATTGSGHRVGATGCCAASLAALGISICGAVGTASPHDAAARTSGASA